MKAVRQLGKRFFFWKRFPETLQLASLASWGRGWLISHHFSQGPSLVTVWQGEMHLPRCSAEKNVKEHSVRTIPEKCGLVDRMECTWALFSDSELVLTKPSALRASPLHCTTASTSVPGRGPLSCPYLLAGQAPPSRAHFTHPWLCPRLVVPKFSY